MVLLSVALEAADRPQARGTTELPQRSFAHSLMMLRRQVPKLLQHCSCCVMAFWHLTFQVTELQGTKISRAL